MDRWGMNPTPVAHKVIFWLHPLTFSIDASQKQTFLLALFSCIETRPTRSRPLLPRRLTQHPSMGLKALNSLRVTVLHPRLQHRPHTFTKLIIFPSFPPKQALCNTERLLGKWVFNLLLLNWTWITSLSITQLQIKCYSCGWTACAGLETEFLHIKRLNRTLNSSFRTVSNRVIYMLFVKWMNSVVIIDLRTLLEHVGVQHVKALYSFLYFSIISLLSGFPALLSVCWNLPVHFLVFTIWLFRGSYRCGSKTLLLWLCLLWCDVTSVSCNLQWQIHCGNKSGSGDDPCVLFNVGLCSWKEKVKTSGLSRRKEVEGEQRANRQWLICFH